MQKGETFQFRLFAFLIYDLASAGSTQEIWDEKRSFERASVSAASFMVLNQSRPKRF
jgi:hypothetical protein